MNKIRDLYDMIDGEIYHFTNLTNNNEYFFLFEKNLGNFTGKFNFVTQVGDEHRILSCTRENLNDYDVIRIRIATNEEKNYYIKIMSEIHNLEYNGKTFVSKNIDKNDLVENEFYVINLYDNIKSYRIIFQHQNNHNQCIGRDLWTSIDNNYHIDNPAFYDAEIIYIRKASIREKKNLIEQIENDFNVIYNEYTKSFDKKSKT